MQQQRADNSSKTQGATPKDSPLHDASASQSEVVSADNGDPMDVQSSGGPVKRGPPVNVLQQDVIASEQPAKKVRATPDNASTPSPSQSYPTPTPSQSYRVHIRPLSCYDITSVPTKHVQRVIDHALETKGYKGFAAYKSTNTITVHLASLNDVQKICTLTSIPLSEDRQLPVQCYFASGPNIQRCVVYGIDPEDSPEIICRELTSTTHRVLAARFMGKSRTCLVTVQGPHCIPDKFYYYGCLLRPKPYLPRAIFCYRCFQRGHMQAFCPQRTIDPERLTPEGEPRYRCGLCKSDEHDMTSINCPTKQKATARLRKAIPKNNIIRTNNRFEVLAEEPEVLTAEDTQGPETQLYSSVLKRGKQSQTKQQKLAAPSLESDDGHDDIDARIDALAREIERLRKHKELVILRRQKTGPTRNESLGANSPVTPATRPAQQVNQAVWTAVLDQLAQLTLLIQDCLHHG